uniref:Uncharacterized protein n=1 Tax=Glossina palpalis gambiensis TaxID=67801 RepID=A0A1B0B5D6_9MUSC
MSHSVTEKTVKEKLHTIKRNFRNYDGPMITRRTFLRMYRWLTEEMGLMRAPRKIKEQMIEDGKMVGRFDEELGRIEIEEAVHIEEGHVQVVSPGGLKVLNISNSQENAALQQQIDRLREEMKARLKNPQPTSSSSTTSNFNLSGARQSILFCCPNGNENSRVDTHAGRRKKISMWEKVKLQQKP